MKIKKFEGDVRRMQEGGAMPAEAAAPEQQAANPEEQLQEMAGQLVQGLLEQIGDPQAVMAVLQMAAEMVGQAAGAPAEAAPQGEPTFYKKGGKICMKKCGGKTAKKKC